MNTAQKSQVLGASRTIATKIAIIYETMGKGDCKEVRNMKVRNFLGVPIWSQNLKLSHALIQNDGTKTKRY